MILTRTVARIAKPLWSSVASQYSWLAQIPCRSITSGHDRPTFGIFDKRDKQIDKKSDDVSLLYPFIGYWDEQSSENVLEYLKAAGLDPVMFQVFEKQKTFLDFSRSGDLWTLRQGYVDMIFMQMLTFRLNESKFDLFEDVSGMKRIFTQDGSILKERQETVEGETRVVDITREVRVKNMTATYKINDVTMIRKYKKRG